MLSQTYFLCLLYFLQVRITNGKSEIESWNPWAPIKIFSLLWYNVFISITIIIIITILRLRSSRPQVFTMHDDPWQDWLSASLEACHHCPPSNPECMSDTVCVNDQLFYFHELVCKGQIILLALHLGGVEYGPRILAGAFWVTP